jgi:hypothetical protein
MTIHHTFVQPASLGRKGSSSISSVIWRRIVDLKVEFNSNDAMLCNDVEDGYSAVKT